MYYLLSKNKDEIIATIAGKKTEKSQTSSKTLNPTATINVMKLERINARLASSALAI